MKFVLAILAAAIVSVEAVQLKKDAKPDNWTEDWGHKFDEKHYG